jgi:hypothetical protein
MRPDIGQWYLNDESKQQFEVVALDLDSDSVEIQYFEGEIDDMDFETWYSLPLISMDAPEDWSGPFETDDYYLDDSEEAEYSEWIDNPYDHIEHSDH